MTIINLAEILAIRHTIAGFLPNTENLPDLSMETVLYLEACHTHELNRHDPTIETINFNSQDWLLRARLASERSYKPILVDKAGNLTDTGRDLAVELSKIIGHIRRSEEDLLLPANWQRVDEMFLKASLPKRSIALLAVVHRAIEDAREKVRLSEERNREEKEQEERENRKTKTDKKPLTVFEQRLYSTEAEDIVTENVNAICYVPTAGLSPKAKYDMEVLIKYCLLDVRFLRPRGRGRPRMAIRVSDLGIRFLKDLETRT